MRKRIVAQVKHMWSINVPTWLELHPLTRKKKKKINPSFQSGSKPALFVKTNKLLKFLTSQRPSDGKKNNKTQAWHWAVRLYTSQPHWKWKKTDAKTQWSTLTTERFSAAPPFYTAPLSPNQICKLSYDTRPLMNTYTPLSKCITINCRTLSQNTPLPNNKNPLWTVRWFAAQGK